MGVRERDAAGAGRAQQHAQPEEADQDRDVEPGGGVGRQHGGEHQPSGDEQDVGFDGGLPVAATAPRA
jgi:hypothetical protein